MDLFSLLKAFTEVGAPSGHEAPVRRAYLEQAARYADEVYQDRIGSAVALKRGTGGEPRNKVLLAGHMDEIGFMVTELERGFLRFTEIGGFDPRVLVGQEVWIHTGYGDLPAVIASRPPHVQTAEEQQQAPKLGQLFLDAGLTHEELQKRVRVGDVATLRRELVSLNGDLATGKALDDRAAVVVLVATLAQLAKLHHTWDVYAVATAQEEAGAGYLGAATSTYAIQPHVGVAIDVTHGQMPGVSEARTIPFGKGPAITRGPQVHPVLYRKLHAVAEAQDIPFVTEAEHRPQGTDAFAIQIAGEGVPTALIGLPLRYMHSTVETVSLKDLERAARLLAHFIAGLDDATVEELSRW